MAFLEDEQEIYKLYTTAVDESRVWRKDYKEYERLADNDLIDDLDENLPEVNDGTLAAALFKLPKRIVNSKLSGTAKSLERDEAWLTEIANMQWRNKIIPNANSQAPFHRKWKDAVRKAAIYGSVPLITLFVERGNYTGADFIVAQPQDVTLEPGKVSDYDSDIMFWDVYFTDLQLKDMIKQAKSEQKEAKKSGEDGYNKWNVKALEDILASAHKQDRESQDDSKQRDGKSVTKGGYHFCIVVQRGVDAPFYMYHRSTKQTVREWSNPDPTGDVPIHFLYCYQDFINPYGIGIVKLAGGTQNALDYFRQADILATQLGFRPPVSFKGDTSETDFDTIIYAQDQQWIAGNADIQREEISNEIYRELPNRINMYKSSLNQLLPMGDSTVSATAGDPLQSKTPAGVKQAAASLSIDDEDFKDNLEMTYAAKSKSMINTHFANMQGTDLMKLSDEEQQVLAKSGIDFPVGEDGQPTNEFELAWDQARTTFDFEIDAEADKTSDDEKRLDGLLKVAQFRASDPAFDQKLLLNGKKLNDGELYSEIIALTTDNDKILEDISPEDKQAAQEQAAQGGQTDPNAPQQRTPAETVTFKDVVQAGATDAAAAMLEQAGLPSDGVVQAAGEAKAMQAQQMQMSQQPVQAPGKPAQQQPQPQQEPGPDPTALANVQAVMQKYNVDEGTAAAMLEAERQGYSQQEIESAMVRNTQGAPNATA